MEGRLLSDASTDMDWSDTVAIGRDSGDAVSSWILEADSRLTPLWSLDFVPERSLVFLADDGLLRGPFFGVVCISSVMGRVSVDDSIAEGVADVSASETAQDTKPSRLWRSVSRPVLLRYSLYGERPLAQLADGGVESSKSEREGAGDGR